MKNLRQVGSYTLAQKKDVYCIDNGIGNIIYNDKFDVGYMINCSSVEFVNKCLDLFD